MSWRNIGGAANAGTVRFEPMGADRTLVRLALSYDPEGVAENVGSAIGAMQTQAEKSVRAFMHFIEERGAETGAWRGDVHDGPQRRSV